MSMQINPSKIKKVVSENEYPLFETIAIHNGIWQNIQAHQQRYQQSLLELYGSIEHIFDLSKIPIPSEHRQGLVRCRINYNRRNISAKFFSYQAKNIKYFQPVICDRIDYHLKYYDRSLLDELLLQKNETDEIIIIKDGMVTDCSIGNLILRKNHIWYTPDTPLLAGTMRQQLLNQGRIRLSTIPFSQLNEFEEIRLINALNPHLIPNYRDAS